MYTGCRMIHHPEDLAWSFSSFLGAILGYSLHIVLSWGEWRKLTANKALGLREFIAGDPPGQLAGLITVIIVYFSLSAIGQWKWLVDVLGFVPKVNFFSAAVTAFASQGIGVKLRNVLRRLNGD